MSDKYQPLRDALDKAAEEIADAGHAGWGNVCREASDTIAALLAERDALRRQLFSAVAEVEVWSLYAPQHVREKHDIEGKLSRFRAALSV